jgi:MtN3 and saliva related transmembrane protein
MRLAFIGYAAGTLTTLSFVPQVWRAWHTRHTDDLAWAWLVAFQAGLSLWLIYGVILRDWPIILANFVTIALCAVLMLLKARTSRSRTTEPDTKLAQVGD